jgi:hypothetical protein
MSELYHWYSAEVNSVRRRLSQRELGLWLPLWKALLDLCGDVEDSEVLARAMTAHGPVSVTAGLVRGLLAACKCAPGEECLCTYDCECREQFRHILFEDAGMMNCGVVSGEEEFELIGSGYPCGVCGGMR